MDEASQSAEAAGGDAPERSEMGASGVVGLLLAGGASRRAGLDKRYFVLEGRTLLRRNLELLRTLFATVVVSVAAGQEVDLGDALEVDLLPDAYPGRSPLAGIVTALERFERPVFALACDLAFAEPAAARRVLAAAAGRDVALPAVGEHVEPLFAVYAPSCVGPMRRLLERGEHRIMEAFAELDVAAVPFADAAAFHNINTMDDFLAARRSLTGDPSAQPALVAVVGKSDSGKTTLLERLIPALTALGLRVGSVKHDAHSFEIDHPGKDSWRHGQAGGEAYAVASPQRLAFITRLDGELPLQEIARHFFAGFDILVAEGYKRTAPHRVEIFRRGAGHETPLCGPGEALALVTDADLPHEHRFGLDDSAPLARFLAARLETLKQY